jgi:hypothetical protein
MAADMTEETGILEIERKRGGEMVRGGCYSERRLCD